MTLDEFVSLSAVLTGYPAAVLKPSRDTQQILPLLYAELTLPGNNVPADKLASLTQIWNSISATPPPQLEAAVKAKIIENPDPVISRLAQNMIYLWYFGIWYDLGASPNNDHVVSPLSYTNGLVWGEMGAHPMGFSTGEFGYWANAPVLPAIN
jgi:hypothetical protein